MAFQSLVLVIGQRLKRGVPGPYEANQKYAFRIRNTPRGLRLGTSGVHIPAATYRYAGIGPVFLPSNTTLSNLLTTACCNEAATDLKNIARR